MRQAGRALDVGHSPRQEPLEPPHVRNRRTCVSYCACIDFPFASLKCSFADGSSCSSRLLSAAAAPSSDGWVGTINTNSHSNERRWRRMGIVAKATAPSPLLFNTPPFSSSCTRLPLERAPPAASPRCCCCCGTRACFSLADLSHSHLLHTRTHTIAWVPIEPTQSALVATRKRTQSLLR